MTPINYFLAASQKAEEEDDDDDLFASDDEDVEKRHAERIAAYNAKKIAKAKDKPVAKSMIILDVKPWDDETDMAELEKCVRGIEADGLLWGTSKLVELVHGIKKLQITCVVEDDKVCALLINFSSSIFLLLFFVLHY